MRTQVGLVALVAVVSLLVPGTARAQFVHQVQPVAEGRGGAATTVDRAATTAAIDVLKRGGNAVDAAVAAAAVLGVTEPYSAGIGGGGFLVIHRAADRRLFTIDHRERAPAAMRPDSFIDPATGKPMPFSEAQTSGLSAGVPGTLAGWEEALDRFGTMKLSALLLRAIRVAEEGFVVDETFFSQTNGNKDRFDDFTTTRDVFLTPAGEPYPVGSVFRNPDLARTYRMIAERGIDVFYRGPIARSIVDVVQNPPVVPGTTRNVRPGLMTLADLAAYRAPFRPPAKTTYRGLLMNGMGPPSSGGSTIGEALNILEGFTPLGATRSEGYHRVIEASALSFADRNAYLGDADYVDVPLAGLLSKSYAAERRANIGPTASPKPVPAGNPWPHETTHLTVSDKWGNVVSYTYTIESVGGNGIVAGDRGFLLNNELTDFNFVPGTANSPAGGKRPRSSMSPTIMTSPGNGKPVLALGSPGGATIITTVLEMLVNRIDFSMPLPDALAAPRFSNLNSASTFAEPAFISSPEAVALQALGHSFRSVAEIGAATGIEFFSTRGVPRVQAAAEPVRRGGGNAQVAPAASARACALAVRPRALRAGVRTRVTVNLRRALGMPAALGTRIVVRGAGVNRTVRTRAGGRAAFAVRPTRAGVLTVRVPSVARCAARLGVRAAPVAVRLTGAR